VKFSDFFPADDPPTPFTPAHASTTWLHKTVSIVDAAVPAIGTVLLIGGPYCIIASAGLGLIWAGLRSAITYFGFDKMPPKAGPKEIHESMSVPCKTAMNAVFRSDHARQGASALNNFQDWLHGKQSLFNKTKLDDLRISQGRNHSTRGKQIGRGTDRCRMMCSIVSKMLSCLMASSWLL
jgi:hypothetical protein